MHFLYKKLTRYRWIANKKKKTKLQRAKHIKSHTVRKCIKEWVRGQGNCSSSCSKPTKQSYCCWRFFFFRNWTDTKQCLQKNVYRKMNKAIKCNYNLEFRTTSPVKKHNVNCSNWHISSFDGLSNYSSFN